MKTDKNKAIKITICIISLCFTAAVVFFFSDALITLTAEIMVKSAVTYLPQKGLKLNSPPTTSAVTTEPSPVTQETVSATAVTEKEEITTTEKAVQTVKELKFNRTDSDIAQLIKEAQKKSKKDKKDGKISEYTYKNDGVTDKYGLVRVKNVNNKTVRNSLRKHEKD